MGSTSTRLGVKGLGLSSAEVLGLTLLALGFVALRIRSLDFGLRADLSLRRLRLLLSFFDFSSAFSGRLGAGATSSLLSLHSSFLAADLSGFFSGPLPPCFKEGRGFAARPCCHRSPHAAPGGGTPRRWVSSSRLRLRGLGAAVLKGFWHVSQRAEKLH